MKRFSVVILAISLLVCSPIWADTDPFSDSSPVKIGNTDPYSSSEYGDSSPSTTDPYRSSTATDSFYPATDTRSLIDETKFGTVSEADVKFASRAKGNQKQPESENSTPKRNHTTRSAPAAKPEGTGFQNAYRKYGAAAPLIDPIGAKNSEIMDPIGTAVSKAFFPFGH